MNINEGEQHNNILSNNRVGSNNVIISLLSFVMSGWGILLAAVFIAGAVCLAIINVHTFASVMSVVFYIILILLGAAAVLLLLWFLIKHILGGIIEHVIGKFIKHVVEPLRKDRVEFANDNFVAHVGEVVVTARSEDRHVYNYKQLEPPKSEQALALPPPRIYYARSLYENGYILKSIQQGKIIMGYGEKGQVLLLPRSKFFSTIDAGIPSSGKTTTAFWQVAQQIVISGRLIVIDPHMYYTSEDGEKSLAQELEPFRDSFVFPPCDASLSGPIMQRVKYMRKLVDDRKKPGYIARLSDTVLLVMEECNSVFDIEDIRDELADDLAYIQREGRKYNVHTMLIGHRFSKDDIGSVKIRTIASTVMVHRFNDEGQAGILLGRSNAKKALQLHPGSYWFSSINELQSDDGTREFGPVRVQTPMISAADASWVLELKRQVAQMEVDTSAPTSGPLPGDFQTGPLDENGSDWKSPSKPLEVESDPNIEPALLSKMYKVMELDEVGDCTQTDLIAQVWGPEYTSGRRLYEALDELKQIRRAMAARLKQYRSIA